MKFLRSSVLVAVAVASAASLAVANVDALPAPHEAGWTSPEMSATLLRRELADGSASSAPPPTTTSPTPTTTAPTPTTTAPPTPTTTSPSPTTVTPEPTTATPEPTTEAPTTTTPSPTTTSPAPTTAAPEATTATPTPTTTTAAPTTETPTTPSPIDVSSAGSSSNEGVSSTPSPVDGAGTDKLNTSSSSGKTTSSKSSSMSTGTIIGIVVGIVVGVAILAFIAVVLARKRREEDDDPLSPFELSMDKGYNGNPNQPQQNNQYGNNNTIASYNNGRTANNAAAIGAGAAVGAGAGAAMMMTTNTPAAGSEAAGVAYTQFYDPVTSPESRYGQQQSQDSYATEPRNNNTTDDANLWMSAMEPKENDVEGFSASVPPEVSLPGDMQAKSSFLNRSSYDELPNASVDIDQSSVLSGGSDLDKDFPDFEDESSRGSYEL